MDSEQSRRADGGPGGGPWPSAAGHWDTPLADGPVRAEVTVPGSKSMTNRALILAALADGPTTILRPLDARDTRLMRDGLTALGCRVDDTGLDRWRVTPGRAAGDVRVDVGNSGTVMRFLPAVAALTQAAAQFHGDPRASQRPVGPILAALRDLGAVIDDGGDGAIPFTVRGTGSLAGGTVSLDASASSQLISGLLLAAPRYDKGVEVHHRGTRAPSAPHITMTLDMLREAGADAETISGSAPGHETPGTWRVHPGVIGHHDIPVQPDLSNAVPFLAAALATAGTVTVRDWPTVTAQPAQQILGLLTAMGATCTLGSGGLTVTGGGAIHGVDADLADFPETTPVAAALAALADSPSRLTGVAHIRQQETDRLAALAAEITALGGDVTELPDGLEIRPRPLLAGDRPFRSYDDHRMVMAAAVLGLAVPGITVENAATVGKTFPAFTRQWAALLEREP